MPLDAYKRRRDFGATPEPQGDQGGGGAELRYVIQKHAARRLHFDLRLEWGGALWSWAVPKGPSLDPAVKRLAMRTEDHPIAYTDFEGLIPKDQYGAGPVIVWDRGTWIPRGDPDAGIRKGHLGFELRGERLTGRWTLIRIEEEPRESWLLRKVDDDVADPQTDVVDANPASVVSGRTLDQVASRPERLWRSDADPVDPDVEGAVRAPMPRRIEPMIPTAVKDAPDGARWVHEIKFDGYRVAAHVEGGRVKILTRNGLDWTSRFGPIAEVLGRLPVRNAVVDGEIVVLDAEGASDFGALQQVQSEGRADELRLAVFDLPYLDDHDLRRAPLLARKALLRQLVDRAPSPLLRYSDHVEGRGSVFHEHACQLGLEGIVSKQADAPYTSGRVKSWLKTKCLFRQEFVVIGYQPSDQGVGSLILGVYDGDRLRCVGKVGTGFTTAQRRQLARDLGKRERPDGPACDDPGIKGARWVEPERVAEVAFTSWTRADKLRHPSFQGFREDKDPREVRRDRAEDPKRVGRAASPSPSAREALGKVRFTSPDKVLYPGPGITKAEVMAYWASVADRAMTWLAGRPLTLVRCPDGVEAACFFQKHAEVGMPDAVGRVAVPGDDAPMLTVDTVEGLLSLVQMSALEVHPWSARSADLEHPEMVVFDLDPDPETPWSRIAETSWRLRDRLGEVGMKAFVRATGGKGVHVVAPLATVHTWDAVRGFAEAVAASLVRDTPDLLTLSHAKKGRRGRLYIDVLRNARGSTAIGMWSTRARPTAGVCVPIRWDEVAAIGRGDRFTVRNVHARLANLREDPWDGFFDLAQEIPDDLDERLGAR